MKSPGLSDTISGSYSLVQPCWKICLGNQVFFEVPPARDKTDTLTKFMSDSRNLTLLQLHLPKILQWKLVETMVEVHFGSFPISGWCFFETSMVGKVCVGSSTDPLSAALAAGFQNKEITGCTFI